MRCRNLVLIIVIALLLLLLGCTKAECKKDEQCVKAHFTGKCVEKKCVYTPIPNECGNLKCEENAKENKCTCPVDCGECTGKVGKYLVQTCNKDNECVQDIPATAQKPITQLKELTTGGTKISLTTLFNQPFNTKKDQFGLEFGINVLAPGMSDIKINRLELTGMTPDKRTIPLADKTINRNLFEGSKVKERLIIDFPTADRDGELTNLILKVYLDYVQTTGTTSTPKSTILQQNYQALKFAWAMPEKSPGCPAKCEEIPGMKAECSEKTNYFCEYTPIPGACGNGICDASENKCTCPADCGPCTGGGAYTTRSCVANNCATQLRQGITIKPQSLLDDRPIGPFALQNTYKYNSPFNTKTDKFIMEFKLKEKQDTVTSVRITEARLLDGSQEIASASIGKELTTKDQVETVEITIPTGPPEQERSLSLHVWYEYVQNEQTKSGDYTKALGKVAILSPDV